METIRIDFIEVEYHFWKPNTYIRVQFEENYNISLLPQIGNLIVINNKIYIVKQLVYYPFGDKNGQIGIIVYLNNYE